MRKLAYLLGVLLLAAFTVSILAASSGAAEGKKK